MQRELLVLLLARHRGIIGHVFLHTCFLLLLLIKLGCLPTDGSSFQFKVMTAFAEEHLLLVGILLLLLQLLERYSRFLVVLIQLLRVALRYQLLKEVHLDRRDLVNAQHLDVWIRSRCQRWLTILDEVLLLQLLIHLKYDLDEDLDVERLYHVLYYTIINLVLL